MRIRFVYKTARWLELRGLWRWADRTYDVDWWLELRRLSLLVIAAGLASCDSCLPESFRATPKAGFERAAAARHAHCVATNPCQHVQQCHRESEAFCLDAGYPKTCGNGEVEGSCGTEVR